MTALAMANVPTGSGYKDNEHMLRTIARVSGGNTDLATKMLGTMRGEAKQAGRSDLGNVRFSLQQQKLLDEIRQEGHGTDAQSVRDMALSAFSQTNAYTMANERTEPMRNYARHIPGIIEDLRANPRQITLDDGSSVSSEEMIGRLTAQLGNVADTSRESGLLDRARVSGSAAGSVPLREDEKEGFIGPVTPEHFEIGRQYQNQRSRYAANDPNSPSSPNNPNNPNNQPPP
jgi:hypothetical protein